MFAIINVLEVKTAQKGTYYNGSNQILNIADPGTIKTYELLNIELDTKIYLGDNLIEHKKEPVGGADPVSRKGFKFL